MKAKKTKLRRICTKCGKKFVNNGANCKLCNSCWENNRKGRRK